MLIKKVSCDQNAHSSKPWDVPHGMSMAPLFFMLIGLPVPCSVPWMKPNDDGQNKNCLTRKTILPHGGSASRLKISLMAYTILKMKLHIERLHKFKHATQP